MARFVWESRERSLPHGVAPGSCGDHTLPHRVPTSASAHPAAARRAIWQRDSAGRSSWLRLCDPRQRVQRARSSARPGTSAPACRSVPAADSKVRSCAASTTVQTYRWGLRACGVAWLWPPIQPAKRRARLASRVRALSTNCSSPRCHSRGLPLPMSSNCICIAAPYAPQLSDEDDEQDPDRWCSHSAWGQECWQLVSQWVWNLRLELGHQLEPTSLRLTEFAPAIPPQGEQATASTSPTPASGYGPPATATAWKTHDLRNEIDW